MTGLLALLLGVAACGGGHESGKPAEQILHDAQAAAEKASSVHIVGDVTRGGVRAKLDLLLADNGDGREQITTSGRTVEVVKVGQVLYVRGVPGLSGPGYRRLSLSDPRAAPLVRALDKKAVFMQLVNAKDTVSIIGIETVNGSAAVKLKSQTGPGILYVADDAERPYPLRVDSTASGQGVITFSDWGADVTIPPPPGSGG
ncbi:MAG: hypothetical protein DLM60_00870 [Pseudonocardiales bacterium]|nr:MAG: hypothetical protein DLM60_00870 [Pseudonocardiales bacterium]